MMFNFLKKYKNETEQTHYSSIFSNSLIHDCSTCYYRHKLCKHNRATTNCDYWKPGGCYSCEKSRNKSYSASCEPFYCGGCSRWELRNDYNELKNRMESKDEK